jgi:hypothetical protein
MNGFVSSAMMMMCHYIIMYLMIIIISSRIVDRLVDTSAEADDKSRTYKMNYTHYGSTHTYVSAIAASYI